MAFYFERTSMADPAPSATRTVGVALAPQSDTGAVGDNRTSLQTVTLNFTNTSGVTWLDNDGNATFDIGTDTPLVGTSMQVALQPGANAFRFYQQKSGSLVSDPTYLFLDFDYASYLQQMQQAEATLAKAALAYFGRPLTSAEVANLAPLVLDANGDPGQLVSYLSQHPEFYAVYAVPDLEAGVDRACQMLFGRAATADEIASWEAWVAGGGYVTAIPWLIANGAGGEDASVLSARVLFSQQAMANHDANMEAAGVSERTLLEVERAALENVLSLDDVSANYETIVSYAKTIGTVAQSFAGPRARLDAGSDTGTAGDFATTQQIVKVNVSGIRPGAIAWLDTNGDGVFDPGADYPVINGSVYAVLANGPNALTFYQMLAGETSDASYLTVTLGNPASPITQLATPVLDLNEADDDGIDKSDNVTSKYFVRIDVSGLDPAADMAWIDLDGNGAFDLAADIRLTTGAATTSTQVTLDEGVNGLAVYQVRDGLKSAAGMLTIFRANNTDTVQAGDAAIIGNAMMLEFDRAVDWTSLDANGDGALTAGLPGSGAELEIAWGSAGGETSLNDPSAWSIPVPPAGSLYLTVSGLVLGDPDADPATNNVSILVTGVPDVGSGITSDVLFEDIA